MNAASGAKPVLLVAGTRPEIIKVAPVLFRMRARLGTERVHWVSTGQHEALEQETLASFDIAPDHRLEAGHAGGSLLALHERIVAGFDALQGRLDPALVLVQGDTATAFAVAFAAFHGKVPIGHIEAGLRSWDLQDPFPEESYRRMIDTLASIHFAPTAPAAANLRAEDGRQKTVLVTGNTVVDALALVDAMEARRSAGDALPAIAPWRRLLFVTLHRRESWGAPLEGMCLALRDIAERFDDVEIVLPVHVNPRVRDIVEPLLRNRPRITLLPPLDYAACHGMVRRAYLILTDSGGVQEEAPSYGVPVLVLRRVTERPEAVAAGMALLLGTDRQEIVSAASRLLQDRDLRRQMSGGRNPYGDGRAAERIVLAVERFLSGEQPLLTEDEQFAG